LYYECVQQHYFTFLLQFMKLRTRIIIAFTVLSALIVIPNYVQYFKLRNTEKSLTDIIYFSETANLKISNIMASLTEMRSEAEKIKVFTLNKYADKKVIMSTKAFFDADEKVRKAIDSMGTLFINNPLSLDKLEKDRIKLSDYYNELSSSVAKHPVRQDFAQSQKLTEIENDIKQDYQNTLLALNGFLLQNNKSQKERTEGAKSFFHYLIFFSIFISFTTAFFTLDELLNPLKIIIKATRKIGAGDYAFRLTGERKDEFGQLITSFNQMLDELNHAKLIENQKVELEKLNKELNLKNDSLDSFVYRVSHDLKAPIINISSLLSLVKKRVSPDDAVLKQTFGFIDDSIKRLQTTIYDLLEVSRIERSLHAEKQEVDIDEVLSGIKEQFRETIRREEAEILTDYTEGGRSVYFSDANMNSVLSNIVSNAIKYKYADRKPQIKLSTHIEGEFLKLTIEDNGMGFDTKRNGEKMFKMFSRFHSHVEGSGVGLYIVHKLVTESGGKIVVESEIAKGTTFTLYFKTSSSLEYA
jgi:signal transduction histidine kinase